MWYWVRYTFNLPCCVVFESASLMLRYNGGTAAFGAFMIDILRPILLVLNTCFGKSSTEYFVNGRETETWLTKMLRLYNRNALIMCALSGDGLRKSARNAYELVRRNTLGCTETGQMTDVVFGFAKMLSIVAMTILAVVYSKKTFGEIPVTPIVVVVIGAYIVAGGFFSVYVVAVDTLVLCARKFSTEVFYSEDFLNFHYISLTLREFFWLLEAFY